ncbi:MAG: anaerobic ribonucleoside-triphosphate reductase activating protein [Desulfurococcaceae archaeon]
MTSPERTLLIAGWKSVSLVDVYGHPSFTLWLCGCNLSCPFCHNWRIANAEGSVCRYVDVQNILEEVHASRALIDYFHVTGGEPLLQHDKLAALFLELGNAEIPRSLNSNLTLIGEFKYLAERGLVDHVVTDLKAPPEELYGLPPTASRKLWQSFLSSLLIVGELSIPLELRIPVHRKLSPEILSYYISQITDKLRAEKTTVVVNPLLGEPLVSPRSSEWSREYCGVNSEHLSKIVEALKSHGFSRIFVKAIPGFQQ